MGPMSSPNALVIPAIMGKPIGRWATLANVVVGANQKRDALELASDLALFYIQWDRRRNRRYDQ